MKYLIIIIALLSGCRLSKIEEAHVKSEDAESKCGILDKIKDPDAKDDNVKSANATEWITKDCKVDVSKSEEAFKIAGVTAQKFLSALVGKNCYLLSSKLHESQSSNNKLITACTTPILGSLCYAHYNAVNQVVSEKVSAKKVSDFFEEQIFSVENTTLVKDAIQDPAAKPLSQHEVNEKIAKFFISSFRGAVVSCLSSMAYSELKDLASASGQSALKANASKFLIGAKSNIPEQTRASFKSVVAKEIALAACAATTEVIANNLNAKSPAASYTNECGPLTSQEALSRQASCFRTTASLCKGTAGIIDFAGIYERYSPKTKSSFLTLETMNTLSVATGAVCGLAGKVSSTACGFISEASKEIVTAIETGNNEWANCLGTAKLGACTGAKLGE